MSEGLGRVYSNLVLCFGVVSLLGWLPRRMSVLPLVEGGPGSRDCAAITGVVVSWLVGW